MMRFFKGDEVFIRFGKRQGQLATIVESQPANVYKVKAEDGWLVYYSAKGLERKTAGRTPLVC
jgi:ribosomal protein L24